MKFSDLPGFHEVIDAYGHVAYLALVDSSDMPLDELEGILEGPAPRDWIAALPTRWAGDAMAEPHVAALAEIIRRIAVLSGEPLPDLDPTESALMTVSLVGGMVEDHDI